MGKQRYREPLGLASENKNMWFRIVRDNQVRDWNLKETQNGGHGVTSHLLPSEGNGSIRGYQR